MGFHSERFWSAFQGVGMLDEATYQPPVGDLVVFLGGFKRPGQVVLDGMAHTTDFSIEYLASAVELKRNFIITVDKVQYKVRQTPLANGDGEFFTALLDEVTP
ncbi:hypothetical protein [Duganella phyllosphaerae]|uniref:Uncharacterized protein n=1 Tax=Duganella phyllosphaerae TaxID=762836 RepID=A0A1E7WZA4_9BURK|nr:hypothetical protein [Duganella phyllosphaerae]OFA05188.1 hypothetical protein DUPY_15910 [Duganella phyllosphaerae]